MKLIILMNDANSSEYIENSHFGVDRLLKLFLYSDLKLIYGGDINCILFCLSKDQESSSNQVRGLRVTKYTYFKLKNANNHSHLSMISYFSSVPVQHLSHSVSLFTPDLDCCA